MGTTEYLESLDYGQLQHAVAVSTELLKAKRDETQVIIWRVQSEAGHCLGNFADNDYMSAADLLHAMAQGAEASGDIDYMQISIVAQRVPQSDVDSWLD